MKISDCWLKIIDIFIGPIAKMEVKLFDEEMNLPELHKWLTAFTLVHREKAMSIDQASTHGTIKTRRQGVKERLLDFQKARY